MRERSPHYTSTTVFSIRERSLNRGVRFLGSGGWVRWGWSGGRSICGMGVGETGVFFAQMLRPYGCGTVSMGWNGIGDAIAPPTHLPKRSPTPTPPVGAQHLRKQYNAPPNPFLRKCYALNLCDRPPSPNPICIWRDRPIPKPHLHLARSPHPKTPLVNAKSGLFLVKCDSWRASLPLLFSIVTIRFCQLHRFLVPQYM